MRGKVGELGVRTTATGWRSGWSQLAAGKLGFSAGSTLGAAMGTRPNYFDFAPLPARSFCSGHVFWVQQGGERADCVAVHTTFTEGGYSGKIYRLREAHLWLLDPPSYYEVGGGFLTFTPPQLPVAFALPPERNTSASRVYDDKYKSGWLVPTALRLSPRLRAHLELVRRHILALRDAIVVALLLKRTLILPRLSCLCDRSESPLVLPSCISEVKPPLLSKADLICSKSLAIQLPAMPAPSNECNSRSLLARLNRVYMKHGGLFQCHSSLTWTGRRSSTAIFLPHHAHL